MGKAHANGSTLQDGRAWEFTPKIASRQVLSSSLPQPLKERVLRETCAPEGATGCGVAASANPDGQESELKLTRHTWAKSG
jgi:hypothetical protein